jgi:hypothetical protein
MIARPHDKRAVSTGRHSRNCCCHGHARRPIRPVRIVGRASGRFWGPGEGEPPHGRRSSMAATHKGNNNRLLQYVTSRWVNRRPSSSKTVDGRHRTSFTTFLVRVAQGLYVLRRRAVRLSFGRTPRSGWPLAVLNCSQAADILMPVSSFGNKPENTE